MITSSMESTANTSRTELLPSPSTSTHTPPILRLRLQKKKSGKKVVWTDGTVDNEHMNKKKSKCCCIYKKPSVFGESSSEEEEECEHCFGHPEKRIKNRNHTHSEHPAPSDKDPASSNPDQLPCGSGDCQKNSQ